MNRFYALLRSGIQVSVHVPIHALINSMDERTKLATAFLTTVASLACVQWQCQLILLGVSLLLCLICRIIAGVLIFSGFLVLLGAGIFLYHWQTGAQTLTGMGIMFLVLKFAPLCAMVVFLYKTVNTAQLLRAMARMRLPTTILVPLGVTLRFMPSFIREFSHIRDALAFRGLVLSPKTVIAHPVRVTESVLIPLLMRSLFIGEELSRAALARGFDTPGRPVSLYDIRFKFKDAAWTGLWAAGICLVLFFDRSMGGI